MSASRGLSLWRLARAAPRALSLAKPSCKSRLQHQVPWHHPCILPLLQANLNAFRLSPHKSSPTLDLGDSYPARQTQVVDPDINGLMIQLQDDVILVSISAHTCLTGHV